MIALLVLVGSMAVAANAQNGGRRLVANIPFQFNVGDKTMPAGEYTIARSIRRLITRFCKSERKDGSQSVLIQMSSVIGKCQTARR